MCETEAALGAASARGSRGLLAVVPAVVVVATVVVPAVVATVEVLGLTHWIHLLTCMVCGRTLAPAVAVTLGGIAPARSMRERQRPPLVRSLAPTGEDHQAPDGAGHEMPMKIFSGAARWRLGRSPTPLLRTDATVQPATALAAS
jgi:hypothetical protein